MLEIALQYGFASVLVGYLLGGLGLMMWRIIKGGKHA